MIKLNFLFIVMDVVTLFAYPFIFVHSKLRKKISSRGFIGYSTEHAMQMDMSQEIYHAHSND